MEYYQQKKNEPMSMSPPKEFDQTHPFLTETYTEDDKNTLGYIVTALKKKTVCEICNGNGHQPSTCGTKLAIDNAVKNIPGVRKVWWDMKANKKASLHKQANA